MIKFDGGAMHSRYLHPPCTMKTMPNPIDTSFRRDDHSTYRDSVHDLPMLLTIEETARILRTSRGAVYAMIERALLPGVTRIGRRVLVRSDELLHWLDQKRAPSPKE